MSSSSPDSSQLSQALRSALLCSVVLLVFAGLSWVFVATKPTPPSQEELNARERLKILTKVNEEGLKNLQGKDGEMLDIASSMKYTGKTLLQSGTQIFESKQSQTVEEEPSKESAQEDTDNSAQSTDSPSGNTNSEATGLPTTLRNSIKKPAIANAGSRVNSSTLSLGKRVYERHCMSCHKADGLGNPEAYWPPLVDSEWLSKPVDVLARIVLHGLNGPIEVNGVMYGKAVMTAFGDKLSDEEVAAVLNYVRENFSAESNLPEIQTAQVAQVRTVTSQRDPASGWTVEELQPFFLETAN